VSRGSDFGSFCANQNVVMVAFSFSEGGGGVPPCRCPWAPMTADNRQRQFYMGYSFIWTVTDSRKEEV